MKIDVKEKLVKVDIVTNKIFLKAIKREDVVSITLPVDDFYLREDRFICKRVGEVYEFTIHDEELWYIDFKIRPQVESQDYNTREIMRTLLSLHNN